jgi:hypothetical protein
MPLILVEIIFNNKASGINKTLIDYLENNLQNIITRGQIKFKFTVAQQNDLKILEKKGIFKLPAMIYKNKNIISVDNIIDTLSQIIKTSKKVSAAKSDEEIVQEYLNESLDIKRGSGGKIITDDLSQEPQNPQNLDLDKEARKAFEERGASSTPNNKYNVSSTDRGALREKHPEPTSREDNIQPILNMRNSKTGSPPDDMMETLLSKSGGS